MKRITRTLPALLLLSFLLLPVVSIAADHPRVLGAASVTGPAAFVNDAPLTSGATIFEGDRIRTGLSTTVALRFDGARLIAAPSTDFRVSSARIYVTEGILQLEAQAAKMPQLSGPGFRLLYPRTAVSPAVELRVAAAEARIVPIREVASIVTDAAEPPVTVRPGQTAVLALPKSSTGQIAGRVAALLPTVTIQRSTQQLNAAAQSAVEWQDELRSGPGGRARVNLNDGSILSLGSESSLRITQHDPTAQQSELDLNYGRLRSRVQRLLQPNAKFEIRTPTAVAGVIGTDFFLDAAPDFTSLIVFEGNVRLTLLKTGATLSIAAGRKLIVHSDGHVEGPTTATPAEIAAAQQQTNVQEQEVRSGRRFPIYVAIIAGGSTTLGLGFAKRANDRETASPTTVPF